MRASRFTGTLVLSLLLGTPASGLADPVRYVFTLIADTSGSFEVLSPYVSMNDAGTVASKPICERAAEALLRAPAGPLPRSATL